MAHRQPGARALVTVVVAFALFGIAACGGSSKTSAVATGGVSWPAPDDPMARARAAGLVPETAEQLRFHVHSHLDVFVDGAKLVVPAGLGIDITNPGVHTFPDTNGAEQYGGISTPCDQVCISPLHTHDVSGILHTESATEKNNTLGQLFTEWNVELDARCAGQFCKPAKAVAVYVNGKRFGGDPRTIPLRNLEEIAVVIGTPPSQIPDSWTPG